MVYIIHIYVLCKHAEIWPWSSSLKVIHRLPKYLTEAIFRDIFTLNADYIAWKLLKMALEVEYMMEYQYPICWLSSSFQNWGNSVCLSIFCPHVCGSTFLFPDSNLKTLCPIEFKLEREVDHHHSWVAFDIGVILFFSVCPFFVCLSIDISISRLWLINALSNRI